MANARCPSCGSGDVVPIVYGYPDEELWEASARGELHIGGCVVEPDQPTHACGTCRARFPFDPDEAATLRPWRVRPAAWSEVLGTGDLPVVVHVPHAGLHVPGDVRAGIVLDDDELREELRLITDHRTDVLAAGAVDVGAYAFVNRTSRLVVDPERFPDAREPMAAVGMGPVYTVTTGTQPLRRPTATEESDLLERWYQPYAAWLGALVEDVVDRHGTCVIVDLHSYPTSRLDYELGGDQRPALCVGVDDDCTPAWLAALVEDLAGQAGIDTARNSPFAGTYVPLGRLGDPAVPSVMLEVRRDQYLEEDAVTADGSRWVAPTDGERRITDLVRRIVESAAEHVRGA